jgi:hypothetical protein
MDAMNAPTVLAFAGILAAGIIVFYVWWRRAHRKTPAEKERLRRLAVNASGRLTDGVLMDSPYDPVSTPDSRLLFFRYEVAGVEYTAAQDVSSLLDESDAALLRSGTVAAVKYDPRKPSNSIVLCEQWRGLPDTRPNSVAGRKLAANS